MKTVRGTHAIARYVQNINDCPSDVIKNYIFADST